MIGEYKVIIKTISSKLQPHKIRALEFYLPSNSIVSNKHFTKKTKLLLDFLIFNLQDLNNNDTSNESTSNFYSNSLLVSSLLYHESQITKNTFQPFIIHYLNKNCVNSNELIKFTDFVSLSIHPKYLKLDFSSIKKVIDFTNIKNNIENNLDFVKKNVFNFILNNVINIDRNIRHNYKIHDNLCVCKVNKLITQIVNYVFNLNFQNNNNCIRDIYKFLASDFEKHSTFNIKYVNKDKLFEYVINVLSKSNTHCKISRSIIHENLIEVLDMLYLSTVNLESYHSTNAIKKQNWVEEFIKKPKYIGSFKNLINEFEIYNNDVNNDVKNEFINNIPDILDFIKYLFKKNYYFKDFSYVNEFKPLYYHSDSNSVEYIKKIIPTRFLSNDILDDNEKYLQKMVRKFYKKHYSLKIIVEHLNKNKTMIKNNKSIDETLLLNNFDILNIDTENLHNSDDDIKKKSFNNILIKACQNFGSTDYLQFSKTKNSAVRYENLIALNEKEISEETIVKKTLIRKIDKLIDYFNKTRKNDWHC